MELKSLTLEFHRVVRKNVQATKWRRNVQPTEGVKKKKNLTKKEEPQQPNPTLKNVNPKSKKYPFLQTQIKTQLHSSFDLGTCVAGLRWSMRCWVLLMYLSKVWSSSSSMCCWVFLCSSTPSITGFFSALFVDLPLRQLLGFSLLYLMSFFAALFVVFIRLEFHVYNFPY